MILVRAAVRSAAGGVLVLRRSAHDTLGGHWEMPGGKVDAGEQPAQAIVRELAEEAGLTVTGAPRLLAVRSFRSPRGYRIREICYEIGTSGEIRLSDEHDAYRTVARLSDLDGPITESLQFAMQEII